MVDRNLVLICFVLNLSNTGLNLSNENICLNNCKLWNRRLLAIACLVCDEYVAGTGVKYLELS